MIIIIIIIDSNNNLSLKQWAILATQLSGPSWDLSYRHSDHRGTVSPDSSFKERRQYPLDRSLSRYQSSSGRGVNTYIPVTLRNIIKATQPVATRSPSDLYPQVH